MWPSDFQLEGLPEPVQKKTWLYTWKANPPSFGWIYQDNLQTTVQLLEESPSILVNTPPLNKESCDWTTGFVTNLLDVHLRNINVIEEPSAPFRSEGNMTLLLKSLHQLRHHCSAYYCLVALELLCKLKLYFQGYTTLSESFYWQMPFKV